MIRDRTPGFSFIELLATMAIISVLLLIAVPSAKLVTQRHREAELRVALADIRNAIDRYKQSVDSGEIPRNVGESGYPPDLESLVDGVVDASSIDGRKIYYLRRLPPDPLYSGKSASAAETWGLRSYRSPPDEPVPGDDVFDVYSMSPGVGLNGVAYRDW